MFNCCVSKFACVEISLYIILNVFRSISAYSESKSSQYQIIMKSEHGGTN